MDRRIAEIEECNHQSEVTGYSASVIDENDLSTVRAVIKGPVGTPYEGGTYNVKITFPVEYPALPPEVFFETAIWHPNVSTIDGQMVLMNLLSISTWKPYFTLVMILEAIKANILAPNIEDPHDVHVGEQYMENRVSFVNMAREWTESFAKESIEPKVEALENDSSNDDDLVVKQAIEIVNISSGDESLLGKSDEDDLGDVSSGDDLYYNHEPKLSEIDTHKPVFPEAVWTGLHTLGVIKYPRYLLSKKLMSVDIRTHISLEYKLVQENYKKFNLTESSFFTEDEITLANGDGLTCIVVGPNGESNNFLCNFSPSSSVLYIGVRVGIVVNEQPSTSDRITLFTFRSPNMTPGFVILLD